MGSLFPFPNLAFSKELINKKGYALRLLKKAREAKRAKQYEKAERLFKKVIDINPKIIPAYYGLKKVYALQKGKQAAIIRILKKGVKNNPKNAELLGAMAKTYANLGLGDKKMKGAFGENENFLTRSKKLYEKALRIRPENKNLKSGLQRVLVKIECNAEKIDARDNILIKRKRKARRMHHKKMLREKSHQKLLRRLEILKAKPFHKARREKIKTFYRELIRRARKKKQYSKALEYAQMLYQEDTTDPLSLYLVRRLCKGGKNYEKLISINEQNFHQKKTFRSAMAWFSAKLWAYQKGSIGSVEELSNTLTKCQKLPKNGQTEKKEFKFKEIVFLLVTDQQTKSLEKLIELGKNISYARSVHQALRYNRCVTRYYIKTGQKDKAIFALNQLLEKNNEILDNTDELLLLTVAMNRRITIEKSIHIQQIKQLRSKLLSI